MPNRTLEALEAAAEWFATEYRSNGDHSHHMKADALAKKICNALAAEQASKKNLKVEIWTDGDRSVGIGGENATVELEGYTIQTLKDNDGLDRVILESIQEAFEKIFDFQTHVQFSHVLNAIPEEEWRVK